MKTKILSISKTNRTNYCCKMGIICLIKFYLKVSTKVDLVRGEGAVIICCIILIVLH